MSNTAVQYHGDAIEINSLLWDLVESNDTFIINLGIFTNFEKAVGEAFRIASDSHKDCMFTSLYKLEADSGFGFHVKDKDSEVLTSFYILEVSNEGDIISDQ